MLHDFGDGAVGVLEFEAEIWGFTFTRALPRLKVRALTQPFT